jgi:WD40 repeat protein
MALMTLCLSSCVELTDFNFSAKPTKITVIVPEYSGSKEYKAEKLGKGAESSLDLGAKVQKGLSPLIVDNALTFSPHNGVITGLIPFGEDSVITSGNDGQVLLSRLKKDGSGFISEVLLSGTKPILGMSLSDDRSMLAVTQTSLVIVYDFNTRRIVYELSRVRGRITSLAWDPRGELIVLGLTGGDIYIWSLKQSFFGGQGRDSFDSLEHYIGSGTPIVGLHFLPSGGAFFSAELEGKMSTWRALRTEEELGLRDKFNLDDREAISSVTINFANIGPFATDSLVTADGSYFLASSSEGRLFSWKIRGLVAQIDSKVSDSLLSITEIGFGDKELRNYNFLLSAAQNQKIQLLCQKRSGNQSNTALEYVLLAETPPMNSTLSRLRSALSGRLVWAAEKNDKVIAFQGAGLAEQLKQNPRLQFCSRN